MLASIPVNELAQTLRVLAGDNAANAARHFTKRSHDMGDESSAVLWSTIMQCLGAEAAAVPDASETDAAADPTPSHEIREGIAMQDVRFEDVDPESLAGEDSAPEAPSRPPIPKRALSLILDDLDRAATDEAESRKEAEPAAETEFAKAA